MNKLLKERERNEENELKNSESAELMLTKKQVFNLFTEIFEETSVRHSIRTMVYKFPGQTEQNSIKIMLENDAIKQLAEALIKSRCVRIKQAEDDTSIIRDYEVIIITGAEDISNLIINKLNQI